MTEEQNAIPISLLLMGDNEEETAKSKRGRAPRRLVRVWTIHRVWFRSGSGTTLVRESAGWENHLYELTDGIWRRVYHV